MVTQVPELGPVWASQVAAQEGWRNFKLADFERLKTEFGVDWVLVAYPQPGGLACRWHNDAAGRLPDSCAIASKSEVKALCRSRLASARMEKVNILRRGHRTCSILPSD